MTIWNKTSTDYQQTAYHEEYGTDIIEISDEADGISMMQSLIHNPNISDAILKGPKGSLIWSQHQNNSIINDPRR